MSFLRIDDLHIRLGEFRLSGVSLELEKGEYLTIIGPTGAGKTILLECIIGFYTPDRGRIFLDGTDITRYRPCQRNIGIVYQDYALMPHMTVFENIAYGLKKQVREKKAIAAAVAEMADALHIGHILARHPGTLSGGEQQRTALARALIVKPRLLLMDEPLSAVDPQTRREMRHLLKGAIRKWETTVIHITHDLDDAWSLADKVAMFRDGKILQSGPLKEVFDTPRTRFAADFLGVRILEGIAEGRDGEMTRVNINGLILKSATPAEPGTHVRVALRPENIMVSKTRPEKISAQNVIRTTLESVCPENNLHALTLRANGHTTLSILITRNAIEQMELHPGDTVYALIKCTHVRIV
ncbi:ABC transporter ATPase [Desulfonema ishimotonii]|uniref:ABC transporter ATPase n=1 Tax=Desulfonema ishimotonii TaxID=45657 RepID=A0A401FR37_9BACT|nr:ATP-binding cassette domain-containing protein [Desulfonema ishimotonii]GBC59423.1 ABC transporter ATPase [Desulfonema ishimotonii]